MLFSVHWWNYTDLGLCINWHAKIVACILLFRKLRYKLNLKCAFKYGFFPDLGGGSGGVLSMRMQVILDSLFARQGSAPIGGRKKGEFRDWTIASSANQASSGEIKESFALALGFRVIPTKPPLTFVERLKCSRALSVPGHFCSSFHSGILSGF